MNGSDWTLMSLSKDVFKMKSCSTCPPHMAAALILINSVVCRICCTVYFGLLPSYHDHIEQLLPSRTIMETAHCEV